MILVEPFKRLHNSNRADSESCRSRKMLGGEQKMELSKLAERFNP
jgi:hypothetical protein